MPGCDKEPVSVLHRKNNMLAWTPSLLERKEFKPTSFFLCNTNKVKTGKPTSKMTAMNTFTEDLRQLPSKVRRRFTAEKLVPGWEALVVKNYCHVLPGWFTIGATGDTLLPVQMSSAKWAGHLTGPGLVNMIRELWVGLNKRSQAVGQLSKNKFFILENISRTEPNTT